MFIKHIFSFKRTRLSSKVWLKIYEIKKYIGKVIWITGCINHAEAFYLLGKRIIILINRSGWKLTFLYLKEALRIVSRYLAGQDHTILPNGVCLKLDHTGLPTIIPLSLRKILRNADLIKDKKIIVCILSILSMFRVFPTSPSPSLDTIVSEFTGTTRCFESTVVKKALRDLSIHTLRLKSPTLLKLETSSPNSIKSSWSASLEALAFYNPKALIGLLYYNGANWVSLWCVFLLVISFPLYLIFWLSGTLKPILLGRLSVVYDQAGKARVIAITNWWLQVSLKPLHNAVFKVLRKLENCDGTFDQDGALNKFIKRLSGKEVTYHSFDLSAATDRIPIDLQKLILNTLVPSLGDKWFLLLDFAWAYKGGYYKYSVGQPMGAYSSWAMLALTHHVIVRIAALNCGIKNFEDYVILGDDIVIANDDVAREYSNLMKSLGVSINMSKSIVSTRFCEFAKRWVGDGINITPIGPGLTLRLVRDKKYLAMFIRECWNLGLLSNFRNLLDLLAQLRKSKDFHTEANNVLWASFGLSNFVDSRESPINVNTLMWCFSATTNYLPVLQYHIFNGLLQLRIDDKREAVKSLEEQEKFFYQNWWKVLMSKNGPHRILEFLLKGLGPGFWIYALSYEKTRLDLDKSVLLSTGPSWQVIQELAREDVAINISNIDWTQKALVKKQASRYDKLWKEIERSRNEAPELFEEFTFF